MNTQRATNKNVPAANFFETDFSKSIIETIRSSKEKFYCKLSTKLANPSTSSKPYWLILKTFANSKKYQ